MKNILLLLAGILLIAGHVSAQITLSSDSYPSSITGTDSLKMTTAASAFPALTPMADGMWDMSMVTDTAPVYFAYRVSGVAHPFADSNYYNFSGYSYQGNVQSSITSAGIIEYGIDIQRAAYNLFSVTSGPIDSFIINAQYVPYSSPRTMVSFPSSYHTLWTSVYSFDIDFQISIAALSLSSAPGIVRTYTAEKDSVTGWGKMRIKDASGSPSAYLSVLQVQSIITNTDSIFINGTPASAAILLPLGFTQGQKTTTYQQNYYRLEEVTPLAQVTFSDSTYTQPKSATTHVQRLFPVGIAGVFNNTAVKVFPNPVTDKAVSIELPYLTGAWTYVLTDITGKKVTDGALRAKGSTATLLLPASIMPGIYYLKVINNGNQVSIVPLEIVK